MITPGGLRELVKGILGRLARSFSPAREPLGYDSTDGAWDGAWGSADQSTTRRARGHRGIEYR